MSDKIKEVTYNQDLPTIEYSKTRSVANFDTERIYISVKAKTIKDAKVVFDKIKNESK